MEEGKNEFVWSDVENKKEEVKEVFPGGEITEKPAPEEAKGGKTIDWGESDNNYIELPAVGESIEFTIKEVKDNSENYHVGDYSFGCATKDGKTKVRIDLHTDDGRYFTPNNWELFNKLRLLVSAYMAHMEKTTGKRTVEGLRVKITRLINGKFSRMPESDIISLVPEVTNMEQAVAYKKMVAKAEKDKKLYKVEAVSSTPNAG